MLLATATLEHAVECLTMGSLNRSVHLNMDDFPLVTDSFGAGTDGDYLLDLEQRLGVVVECFLFVTPLGRADDEKVHLQIARQGMEERSRRDEEYFANLRLRVIANPDHFLGAVDPNKLGPSDRFCLIWDIDSAASENVF